MKKVLKNAIFLFVLMFSATFAWGQIGSTKTEIISAWGWNYGTGLTTDDNTPYIYYDKEEQSPTSGKYMRRTVFYFTEKGYCFLRKIFEPRKEVNAWVKTFNRDLVAQGNMRWKDYGTGIVSWIETDGEIVIVASYWEEN